ncbi:MAG: response regulator transcription factor [Anaerolineae bacterium]|nr:response regulator transcription factor [Anaerolineae bacterium]
MTHSIPALVMARSGRVRGGLQVLLATVPQIGRVDLVENASDLFDIVRDTNPLLVLLDTNLSDARVLTTLATIKRVRPDTHCLVITDNLYQQKKAKAAGADGVLLRGFSATEFSEMVEALLNQELHWPVMER